MRPARAHTGRIPNVRLPAMDNEYEIRVRGELTYSLSNALTSMGWTVDVRNGSTVIRGFVRDQAELRGVLDAVSNISLDLLEVRRVDQSDESDDTR